MDYTNKIIEATARFHTLYGIKPLKALIPAKDYADTFGELPDQDESDYIRLNGPGGKEYNLLVQPGKVSDVTLMNPPSE